MAVIKKRELVNASKQELEKKLNDLKLESLKASKPAQGSAIKTREIRRTIARILTYLHQKHGNLS